MQGSSDSSHQRLAAATRRLVEAVLDADVTDDELDAATRAADAIADRLERAPTAGTPALDRWRHRFSVNPVAPQLAYDRFPDGVVGRGVFGLGAEGPPGCVHGGWVALAFDEALGVATNAAGHVSVTGRLTIRYRAPTPLHTEVTVEARVERVEGRRLLTVGTMRVDGAVTAEAEGLFIVRGDP